jgi:hypothetical protein
MFKINRTEVDYCSGMYTIFEHKEETLVHKGRTFESNVKNHQIYSELFNGVYKESFHTQELLYSRIARITGYSAMRDG